MPQINVFSYLSQCTWTIILFYIFYYIMKQYLLPFIYENIKLKYFSHSSNLKNKEVKNTSFITKYNFLLSEIL